MVMSTVFDVGGVVSETVFSWLSVLFLHLLDLFFGFRVELF